MGSWLIILLGCQTICPDWSRLDGFYVVRPAPETTDLSGQNINLFVSGDFFALRWSEWDMSYQPAEQSFRIEIDSQPFTAELSSSKENCAEFALSMSGLFTAAEGDERYEFSLEAELMETGPKWKGDSLIDVDWSNTAGELGTVRDLSVYLVGAQPQ